MNQRVYFSAHWLARNLRITRCLYPYENRSWEKMLLMGLACASTPARTIGYQHTSITQSHTNFMLGMQEGESGTLADRILTTGDVIKNRLEKEGNFPPGIFKTACGLRQGLGTAPARERLTTGNKVLVALATSRREYINTMRFLERAVRRAP